jgi:hypothetical protein
MNKLVALLTALTFLCAPTIWSAPKRFPAGKVPEAMLEMRLIGTMLEAYQRESGTYPAAD